MKMNGTHLIAAAMMLGTVTGGMALAADEPAKPAPGTLAGVLDASGITESGYVAASYYHSNGYSTFHQFDVEHDTFQLDQAALTLAYQPKEGFGALVNIGVGEDMRILHTAEDGNGNTFDVIQGFVQYATGPLTVIAGKYVTLAGAEVIAPTGNTQFSRSFLFVAEPLTHTGVRATYAVSETLNVIVGVNNGWNTTSTSYGSKTGEIGLGWTPSKMFAVAAQAYVGKALPYDGTKTLLDFVGTYNATDSLSFVLSYDWGQQKSNDTTIYLGQSFKWNGVAAYANYAISDQWRTSLRVEYLDDKDGFNTGTAQTLKEATITVGYDPVKSFELRFEARYDKGAATFVREEVAGVPSVFANSQTGLALQGIYKF